MMADAPALLGNIKVSIPELKDLPFAPEIKRLDKTAERFIDDVPGAMLNVSIGILIIILGWMLAGWVATYLNRLLSRIHIEETLGAFLASTARFTIFFTIFTTGLTIVGVSSTSIAAVLGAIGLAVGISMRGTLASIAGGLMLIVHRPFKVGDFVENTFAGVTVTGTVKRIGMFSTEINTLEFVRVFIPNSVLWENVTRNHTYNRMHMTDGAFILGYKADVREAFRIAKAALTRHPLVLKTPEPVLSVTGMDEKGVLCKAEAWSRSEDRKTLKDEMMLVVLEALQASGIDMPAPAAAPANAVEEGKAPAPKAKRVKVVVKNGKGTR